MLDPDARVMPESNIDAAFGRSSSIAVNIRHSRDVRVGTSSFDGSAGLVSRIALRYRGGV
jgi:hypothetical protein